MIPIAITKPAANATRIDSATAATGFTGRGAFLIGTIFFASLNGNALRTAAKKPPSRDEAATAF
jgi:hypothetical protein